MKKRPLRGDSATSTCPLRAFGFGFPKMLLVMGWSSVVAPISLLQLCGKLLASKRETVGVRVKFTNVRWQDACRFLCLHFLLFVSASPSWNDYVGSWFAKAPGLRWLSSVSGGHVPLLVGCGLVGGLRHEATKCTACWVFVVFIGSI